MSAGKKRIKFRVKFLGSYATEKFIKTVAHKYKDGDLSLAPKDPKGSGTSEEFTKEIRMKRGKD